MSDIYTATPKIAKEAGHIGGINSRQWVKLPISYWALLEQIRTHPSKPILKDVNDVMAWVIMQEAKNLGIETG